MVLDAYTILLITTTIIIIFLSWIFWPFVIGAGWQPTSKKRVGEMLEMAGVDSEDVVYDLGSGDGRIVIEAARRFHARAVGIEADPLRVLWSRLFLMIFGLNGQVKIVWGNLFHQEISEATVVTLFLWQDTNQRLIPKLLKELKPGTRVVSYYWEFKGWTPTKEDRDEEIYMYVISPEL
jgi:hypothetical protein